MSENDVRATSWARPRLNTQSRYVSDGIGGQCTAEEGKEREREFFRRKISGRVDRFTSESSDLSPHVTPEQELRQADTPRDSRQVLVLPGDDPHPIKSGSVYRQGPGAFDNMRTAGSMWFGRKDWRG